MTNPPRLDARLDDGVSQPANSRDREFLNPRVRQQDGERARHTSHALRGLTLRSMEKMAAAHVDQAPPVESSPSPYTVDERPSEHAEKMFGSALPMQVLYNQHSSTNGVTDKDQHARASKQRDPSPLNFLCVPPLDLNPAIASPRPEYLSEREPVEERDRVARVRYPQQQSIPSPGTAFSPRGTTFHSTVSAS